VEEALTEFRRNPLVEYAEPNFIAEISFTPNDTWYSLQWNMENATYGGVHAESAWDISAGAGSTVAVLDTGVAYENYNAFCQAPDMAGTCFVPGWDFINNDSHANDDHSHGTHVAGTVAGNTNNALGVAGLAFDSCVMPVKVLNASGSGSYAAISNGIIYATDNGAHVISMSLGGSAASATLANALQYAYDNGVTIVAAAGNGGSNTTSYPAAYDDWVIAVGATRFDESLVGYSNYGPGTDLVAPGGDCSVDQNGDGYCDGILQNTFNPNTKAVCTFSYWFFQGTSMATPHVSALAAMVIANGNATTPDDVRCVLEATAEDLGAAGRDDIFGWGLIDAEQALLWSCGGGAPPNQDPTAAFSASCTNLDCSFTDASIDTEGPIASYAWDFGVSGTDTDTSTSQNPSYTYGATGTYTVTLTVTDDDGATDSTNSDVTVSDSAGGSLEVFFDSFENGAWNGLWTEDSQGDWFTSTQRATEGNSSAEVDGSANDAQLISNPINLQGYTEATITFNWYIESGLDSGEYLVFDVSTDGGSSWTPTLTLMGNVDAENTWHSEQVDLSGISSLQLRFRGSISSSWEDANVDEVLVVVGGTGGGAPPNETPVAEFSSSCTNLECGGVQLQLHQPGMHL
jgi:serine protease